MTSPVLDRLKRLVFGSLYLGITGWAVWRTTTFDPYNDTDPLLPALMCCIFAVTAAGAAVGLLFPETDAEPVRVAVDREPVYADEDQFAYADPAYAPARLRGAGMRREAWRPSDYSSR